MYTVTDPPTMPRTRSRATLRYGAILTKPLWIVFKKDMVIKLENELFMNSFKTIDGGGPRWRSRRGHASGYMKRTMS
nr:CAZy families PL1 protein [uncultured bacterium]